MSSVTRNTHKTEAETEVRRSQLSRRLAGVQARLGRKGVGQAFIRAAKPDPMGDMGFMGSLIFNAIVAGPLAGFVSAHVPFAHHEFSAHFNSTIMTGAFEGISALQDIADTRGSREECPSPLYPQGRRKAVIKCKQALNRFNRVANQNGKFSADVQMDLAEMFSIADMLGNLKNAELKENEDQADVSENTKPETPVFGKKASARALRMAV